MGSCLSSLGGARKERPPSILSLTPSPSVELLPSSRLVVCVQCGDRREVFTQPTTPEKAHRCKRCKRDPKRAPIQTEMALRWEAAKEQHSIKIEGGGKTV